MAPRKCFIKICRNCKGGTEAGLHYHGLPKSEPFRTLWLNFIGAANGVDVSLITQKSIFVCSDHFNDCDKGLKKLKGDAVPCILLKPLDCLEEQVENQLVVDIESAEQFIENQFVLDVESAEQHIEDQFVVNVESAEQHIEDQFVVNLEYNGEETVHQFYEEAVNEQTVVVINMGQDTNSHDVDALSIVENINFEFASNLHQEVCSTNVSLPMESVQYMECDESLKLYDGVNLLSQEFSSLCTVDFSSLTADRCLQDNVYEADAVMGTEPSTSENIASPINATRKRVQRKHKVICSAIGCSGDGERMHSFPPTVVKGEINQDNINRCNIGELLNMQHFNPYKKYYLCSRHFDNEQFYNSSRSRLKPTAVPLLFEHPSLAESDVENLFPLTHQSLDYATIDIDNNNDIIGHDFEPDRFQKLFEEKCNSFEWRTCLKCNEKFFVSASSKIKCIPGKNCIQYTALNEMDPGEVPEPLQDLTYIEEQIIARVHPLVTVFKLNGHQYGYSGNVINFPQDINGIARELPHRVEDLSSVLTVKTRNELNPIQFQIRSGKVRAALEWLMENNPKYDDVQLSESNLQSLPEDGNVFDILNGFEESRNSETAEGGVKSNTDSGERTELNEDEGAAGDSDCDERLDSGSCGSDALMSDVNSEVESEDCDSDCDEFRPILEDCDSDFEENHPYVSETVVPMIGRPTQKSQIETVLDWPTIGNVPGDEFKDELVTMAFPCLFPYGKADLNSPREQKITALNYFRHMMRYKDGRFANHPRFRFYALNSLMRWSSLKDGNVFVKRHPEFKDMNVHQLKEEVNKNPHLLNKILFQSSNIRGTRSFWHARGKELISMVEQIGLPTLFFTLSCADFHWPDLYKVLAPDELYENISEMKRRKLIEENPDICDKFFFERANIFIGEVLQKKFDVRDLWFRVEYQHRGSAHIHGLLWLKDAPDVTDVLTDEKKQNIVEFFDNLVKNEHPNVNERPSPIHPSRLKLSEVNDATKDLAQLLNRVQRHSKCTEGYCIRTNKKTKKKECRFKFPKSLQDRTTLLLNEKNEYEIAFKRNDPLLNNYNPYVIQT